jgi:hypothetical protein
MSHAIRHLTYHCSTSERAILKEINSFAYDPQESSGYHGDLTFHKEPVYKNYEEAAEAIKKFDRGWYSDHAVRYRDGRKIYWLVKVEWHC